MASRLRLLNGEHAITWVGVALLLGATRRRRLRRAALRGAFAMFAADATLRTFRGSSDRAHGRRVVGRAAAFATGAAMEQRTIGATLAAAAAATAWSHRDDQRGTPVAAALGAAAATATVWWWPIASRGAAGSRRVRPRLALDTAPTGEGLAVVVNPAAGRSSTPTEALCAGLPGAEVIELEDPSGLEKSTSSSTANAIASG
jgi:undecaprenyl-diphosphatase